MYRDTSDIDFLSALQEILAANPSATQREIARKKNFSLGMTNSWLSRLSELGYLAVTPFGAHRARYAITAEGTRLLAERRADRLRDTFALMRRYRETIGRYVRNAKERGYERVILYGESDLAFLLEYACQQNGMHYETNSDVPEVDAILDDEDSFISLRIIGEQALPAEENDAALKQGLCISMFDLAG